MRRTFLLLGLIPAAALADVRYTLAPEPSNRAVRVTVGVDGGNERVAFRIPAWSPGFYVILNYQAKISDVRASSPDGSSLALAPSTDPRQWVVENPSKKPVTISYRVKGDDGGLGFFGVSVLEHTAFVHGPAAFMFAENRLREPVTLKITNPSDWDTATSMDNRADGMFTARDYDEFVDHPIRLGQFERRNFVVAGKPFEAIFVSQNKQYKPNLDQETARFQRLSLPAIQMFGGAPFKKYVYHVHLAVGTFGGGLEHQASTVLAVPNREKLNIDDLATHEFFHVWDVKHIRPKVLGPFDYTKPVRTDNLWFSEGVDDYYGKLTAYRSGLQGEDYLFNALANEVRHYQSGKTRLEKTLAQSSHFVWEAGSSQGTGDLSYYNKGQLVGFILDAAIRSKTNGAKSFDDVMRYLFARHRLPDLPGFEENGILMAVNAVSGHDLTELYNKMVYSTDELPYGLLNDIGLRVVLPGDKVHDWGFSVDEVGLVQSVTREASSQGIEVGDRVVTVNGKAFSPALRGFGKEGYTVTVRRNGEPMRLKLLPVLVEATAVSFSRDPFATPAAAALADKWLERPGLK